LILYIHFREGNEMRRCILPLLLLPLLLVNQVSATEVTVAGWNILNYPGSTGTQRVPYFRTVLGSVSIDVLAVQEVLGTNGLNHFLNNVLEVVEPGAWAAAGFHDGYDTDRALYYRPSVVEVLDYGWLDTDLRDIDWWQLREVGSGEEFRLFTLHLKASQGSSEEQQRLEEATVLRDYLDTLPPDLPVVVAGDWNIYYAGEPAYQLLLSAGIGQLFDPIDQTGYWHNNASYAIIHTQSTRTTAFGGGATGGMDDRFDQILVTDDLLDGSGVEILPDTYLAYGNDGLHFNQSIINGGNSAVPWEVAVALHESSDHLPVIVDVFFPDASSVAGTAPRLIELRAWPNPFNPIVTLFFELPDAAEVELAVYDVSGRKVAELYCGSLPAGPHRVRWQPADQPAGLYLARLSLGGVPGATSRLVLLK